MKILVSRCLLGESCRYDGRACTSLRQKLLDAGFAESDIVPVCPETDAGLGTPRLPCEIVGGSAADVLAGRARVLDLEGNDRSAAYTAGAALALSAARRAGASCALLKARSPSCGSGAVYDGSFSGRLIPGRGVAAEALRSEGIAVFSEEELGGFLRLAAGHS